MQAQIDRADKSKPPVLTRQGKTITGKHLAPSCDCAVLPWDDCEHTQALEIKGVPGTSLFDSDLARELEQQAREHMRSMT